MTVIYSLFLVGIVSLILLAPFILLICLFWEIE